MKKLFLILIALLVFPSVSAYVQMNIYVDSAGDALFLGQTDESPFLPSGVEVVNGRINGVSSGLTTKEGNVWTFSYQLDDAEMNVILPEGAVIQSLSKGEIFLDRDRFSIFVVDGTIVKYTIEKSAESNNNLAVGLIIIALAVGSIFALFYYIRKGREQGKEESENKPESEKSKVDAVHAVLNDREKIIINELKKTGKIKGSFLRKQCDIPKASFSRHVQELEKKGLVKRTGEGKNKFVELVE